MNLREKTEQQIHQLQKEIEKLHQVQELLYQFPDLKEQTNRWKQSFYTSEKINEHVDQVEIVHSCGCCKDSPLLGYFYKEIHGIKIYASPFSFCIGEKNAWGYGDIPDPKWRETLKKHRIPSFLEKRVEAYFEDHPLESFELLDFEDAAEDE